MEMSVPAEAEGVRAGESTRPHPMAEMKSMSLDHRVAVVTGSDSGIGRAIAIELAQAGADVAVSYHSDREGAEETAARVRAAGARAWVGRLDVTDPVSVASYMKTISEELGRIAILVNNAGMDGDEAHVASISLDEWDKVISVNLRGPFLCTQAVLSDMILARQGVVLNVTSVHETIPWAGHAAYCAAKAGVSMMTRSMALELQNVGVRVVALAPGAIATPINAEVRNDPKGMADLKTKIPLQRVGEPQEIAQIARVLVSDAASYVTGTTVTVDGGMTAYPSFSHGG
ncbi:glucose 1-dehydrogenase [Haloferula luteola]|uniref:Glucose 1-dehydrogenase n=1 Tax=Haloferula luteola TaxID=595692 RepID=A0A840UZL7_9BACT|nr:SDR family oxidoreductase [Haloferula luteola]MBB5351212.1 glucose 1-dehydrogenase [Haloferula luteola]